MKHFPQREQVAELHLSAYNLAEVTWHMASTQMALESPFLTVISCISAK